MPETVFAGFTACDPQTVEAGFEDLLEQTIYDYIVENDSAYSSFLAILEAGEIDKTLSAYNPDGVINILIKIQFLIK